MIQLDFDDFVAWLEARPEDGIAGITGNIGACPVARYATGQEDRPVLFYDGCLWDVQDGGSLELTDDRFSRFAYRLDMRYPHCEVTFAEARAVARFIAR